MLLNTKRYDEGDIISFKLVNGDEVVAKLKQDHNDEFVVTRPCTVLPSPKGLGLVQSMFTSDSETSIHIDRTHVMMHAPTVKQMADYYLETTTGIKPVTASGIIT
jgi:hypothetical protein